MKYLVAIALFVFAVAGATHVPQHTLRGPRFEKDYLYEYDIEFNMTAGVLGLSSQVSASVLRAKLRICTKSDTELTLWIQYVYTSGAVSAIDNKYGDIPLRRNWQLEDRLTVPITFILKDGKITRYTLSGMDNVQARKIKKSILRALEMYISESALKELESSKDMNVPVTYNTTEETEFGVHTTQYMIIASPDTEFPNETMVYNISRTDNFEGERYPSYKLHHNFQKQGCPEVCRKDWRNNSYGAGCPLGHEPHQSPIKTSFTLQQDLTVVGKVYNPAVIRTVEVHYAKMYDQDMEVRFSFYMKRANASAGHYSEVGGETPYYDLSDMEKEINENEINEFCYAKKTADYLASAKNLLSEIAKLIVKGELESDESILVGEKVIMLRDHLSRLSSDDLSTVSDMIKSTQNLQSATDEEKVQRQVWLNILPVIGTSESIKFIVKYVQDFNNLMKWEVKDLLEALPQNINMPTEEDIKQIRILTENVAKESHHLHSAVYLTMAKVIGKTCGNIPIFRNESKPHELWLRKIQGSSENKKPKTAICPEALVTQIVQETNRTLKTTHKPEEMTIFIEVLAHIGTYEVLPVITEYVYGTADNLKELSPRFVNFMRTMALFALHNIAGKYPDEILQIVYPVFFNETETPKVRNAAFGVLIRCQPSLDVLQKAIALSWTEKSYEVGSFVTSTLETFGNSSLPCMQLTAYRIRTVLPQLRRFDNGVHHAKNYFWDYFDDLRQFGLEEHIEYIPSNESFIPSVMYKSLSYSMNSLRDVITQISLNNEGLSQEKIMEKISEYFKASRIPTIENEATLFGNNGMSFIKNRVPEDLRFTVYNKLFYQSSYYYFDASTYSKAKEDIMEVFTKYFMNANNTIGGYVVKLMIPSSYHTVAIAKTLPYPVEFQMRNPIVLALRVKSPEKSTPTLEKFSLHFKPSVYLSKLITHQVNNLEDCKEVGVYHEHKLAASYPFEIKYEGKKFSNVTIKYKIPLTNGRILAYFTESGTYAAKKELERLPSSVEREPIRTLPTLFKFEKEFKKVGMPPVLVQCHTEDTNLFRQKLPRTPYELVDMAVRRILNAGWRHKSVNITFLADSSVWDKETEVTFNVEYLRKHVPFIPEYIKADSPDNEIWNQQRSNDDSHHQAKWQSSTEDEEWTKYLRPFPIYDYHDPSVLTRNAKHVTRILNVRLPHMSHVLKVDVKTAPQQSKGFFRMEYNHTYSKRLYAVHIETVAQLKDYADAYKVSCDHLMGFWNTPDEFTYNTNYGRQQAGFITAFAWPQGELLRPWENVGIAAVGHLKYVWNKETLEDELLGKIEDKYFLPENHEQCLENVRAGMPLSVDCVKAVRELSVYNKLKMDVVWKENLPRPIRQFFRRADIYLKHVFFEHMNLTEAGHKNKGIHVNMDYIDKLVDEPVVDLEILKSSETVMLERIPVWGFQPLSSVYSMYENYLMEVTNNSYPPTCTLMEKYVQTYDLETYLFEPKDCHYVLSTHCTKRKNFAVILHGREEIYIHVGNNTVILTPKRSQYYVVKFDDVEHKIHDFRLLEPENEIYVYTVDFGRRHEHIRVIAKKAGIKVIYDGKNIKIMVDPRYKGELCGLCSEFDGERLREFRGMDRCLYRDYRDFINSAVVKRDGQCKVDRYYGDRLCDNENLKKVWGPRASKDEEYEPRISRNIVITRGNEVCFSIYAFPACDNNDQPIETSSQRVGFHCLPKNDITAKKLVNDAKKRPLEELETKSIDYHDRVQIISLC